MNTAIRLALREELPLPAASERLSADCFPTVDLPPALVGATAPIDASRAAQADGLVWVACATAWRCNAGSK